jgi:hypothetical protein
MVNLLVTYATFAWRPMAEPRLSRGRRMPTLPRLIFMSRWPQVPRFVGLIVAQCVYGWQLRGELSYPVEAAMGMPSAIERIRQSVAAPGAETIGVTVQRGGVL